ncbi:MAG: hypothetical protein KatS3mg082_1184 [Nitrospiraceae bacterium]|nr:MAG: hypothetical protein KatS3mg082_1184 [Nitrospiraceae bacterium]
MRTTLTLDDDVAAQLRRLRQVRKEAKLKELINEALRQGLKHLAAPAGPRKAYHTRAVPLGRCLIGGPRRCRGSACRRGGRRLSVILVDANLLVYAHVSSLPQHEAARAWLDARLNGTAPVGLPWPSLLSFLRLVSNPRVFERPEPIPDAWRQVIEWLDCPSSWVPTPTERHQEVLGPLLAHAGGTSESGSRRPSGSSGHRTRSGVVLH